MDRSDTGRKPPLVTSLQDLTIIEAWDEETDKPKYVTFYHVTFDEELYFGQLSKNKRDITLAEHNSALEYIPDEEIYPEVPKDVTLTIASDSLDGASVFIKRPGLSCYETMKNSQSIPKAILEETLIMEQVSKTHHPNIIGYFGCRVRRGRITARVDVLGIQTPITTEF
ncbi:hypothetical protein BR93DRAFT_960019 [Coniochaeta sp. PMI_546]|nr:hypothetical protein BR93DRAFT_960019 [Coniochaeta sp. PMI_546]